MCCCSRTRPTALCTSIWIIMLASVYLSMSILGYMAYNCDIDLSQGNIVDQVLNLVYFYNPLCNRGNLTSIGDLEINNPHLTVSLAISSPASERTNTWMLVYMGLSAAWIATSLFLLISVIIKSTGVTMYLILVPWVLVTAVNLIVDVITTTAYGIDISRTMTFKDLLEFMKFEIKITIDIPGIEIGPEVNQTIDDFFNSDIPLTWVPSTIMTVFFSRGAFVIWIINFILLIFVVIEAMRHVSPPPKNKIWNDQHIYEEPGWKDKVYSTDVIQRPVISGGRGQDAPTHQVPPNRTTVDKLNSRPDNIGQNKVNMYMAPPPETASWLARRTNADAEYIPSTLKSNFDQRMSSPPPIKNEELRNQLPWSYTQDRSDQLRTSPFRPISHEEAPPVPVPDYTLHFPKRKREDGDRANIRSITPPDAQMPQFARPSNSKQPTPFTGGGVPPYRKSVSPPNDPPDYRGNERIGHYY